MSEEREASIFETLWSRVQGDKTRRKALLRGAKAADPDFPAPEIEMEDAVEKVRAEYNEKLEKLHQETEQRFINAELTRQREETIKALRARGYTDNDFKYVNENMVQGKGMSLESGFEMYDLLRETGRIQKTTAENDAEAGLWSGDKVKAAGGPRAYARLEAERTLFQLRQQN